MEQEADMIEPGALEAMKTPWGPGDFDLYRRFVEQMGVARAKAQGRAFSEVDFIAGALCLYFVMGVQERIPAAWIFGTMLGDGAIPGFRKMEVEIEKAERKVEDRAREIERVQSRVLDLAAALEAESEGPIDRRALYAGLLRGAVLPE